MEYATVLANSYQTDNYRHLLNDIFGNNFIASATPESLDVNSQIAKIACQLGEIRLNDGNTLAVYEVELQDNIHVARNRVSLRNLLRNYWNKYDGAFIVNYKQMDGDWRFSFASETRQWSADGTKYEKAVTDPKRYTYLLGEHESTRTASDRLQVIAKKAGNISLGDVLEAFSVEKLSKAFFADYKLLYQQFCNHLISKPSYRITFFGGGENADKAIRDFTKKFLGRIVFLYFLQKKGWLGAKDLNYRDGDKNFIFNLFRKSGANKVFYSKWLQKLFFETLNKSRDNDDFIMPDGETVKIPFLNGGLFEKEETEKDELKCPDFPKELFDKLFELFNQYNFTIYEDDPNDHTVAVDPEMLGHIFENLLEDNKDKGAYYTPKEIVHYMCQESLIEYLATWFEDKGYKVVGDSHLGGGQSELFPVNEGRRQLVLAEEVKEKQIDREIIEKLLKKRLTEDDTHRVKQYAKEFHAALDEVKICDPAIGSGAFPMGLLQEIFSAKQMLHLFEHDSLESFRASEIKHNIIQNSIYGVDIEKGAVDIARLRFWLSLIIDEELPKPLPNLDYKIVVGNSLISKFEGEVIDIDWEVKRDATSSDIHIKSLQENLKALTKKQREFFQTNNHNKKDKLKDEIRLLKIEILINQISINKLNFANRNVKIIDMYEMTAKDRKRNADIDFALECFDRSIHKLQTLRNQPDKPLQFFDWKLDFPEVMNPILTQKTDGINGAPEGFDIVVGNPPYVNVNNDKTYLKFKTFQCFELYAYFFEKSIEILKSNGTISFITASLYIKGVKFQSLRKHLSTNTILIHLINEGDKIFENVKMPTSVFIGRKNNNVNWCFEALNKEFTLLKKIEENTIPIFQISKIMRGLEFGRDKIKDIDEISFITGSNICKYGITKISYIDKKTLNKFSKEKLFFESERILIRETGATITALYLDSLLYSNRSLYSILITDNRFNIKFVLGCLNSKVLQFYYQTKFKAETELFPKIRIIQAKELPIPIVEKEQQQPVITLVNQILSIKKENPEMDTSELEKEIDRLLYGLYELTEDEISIIN